MYLLGNIFKSYIIYEAVCSRFVLKLGIQSHTTRIQLHVVAIIIAAHACRKTHEMRKYTLLRHTTKQMRPWAACVHSDIVAAVRLSIGGHSGWKGEITWTAIQRAWIDALALATGAHVIGETGSHGVAERRERYIIVHPALVVGKAKYVVMA